MYKFIDINSLKEKELGEYPRLPSVLEPSLFLKESHTKDISPVFIFFVEDTLGIERAMRPRRERRKKNESQTSR